MPRNLGKKLNRVHDHEDHRNEDLCSVKWLVPFSITINVKNCPFVFIGANGKSIFQCCDHLELCGIQ